MKTKDQLKVPPSPLLSPKQAAQYLGVSVRAIELWRQLNTSPPFFRVTKRCIRFRREDLDNWLNERRVAPGEVNKG